MATSLATNLYAYDTRFVFELIQNAEDNKYQNARAANKKPFLHFFCTQEIVVIDTNEDGFTEENIKAICSVGQSTKANVQGYIGEKGIGFKAVFKVASKVHIQSGPYSFAFEYSPDSESRGLGMVTPFNEPHLELPSGVVTRITLHLMESLDRNDLRTQLLEIPDTLLLFLRQLKSLTIHLAFANTPNEKREYTLTTSGNRSEIQTKLLNANGTHSSTSHFWITRSTATDMPHDSARSNIKSAEVVLGFPLDQSDLPLIEEQHTFAFLPLRKMGFKVR